MATETILKLREEISKRRPKFPRDKGNMRKKLRGKGWRRPKGRQAKLRLRRGSRNVKVEDGYRGPVAARDLHKSGLNMVRVQNMKDLLKLNPKEDAAIIADIGQKKKYDLVKKASELSITMVNVKSIQKFLDKIEKAVKIRKHQRVEFIKKRTKKAEKPKKETKKEEKKVEEKKEVPNVEEKPSLVIEKELDKKSREQIIKEAQDKADLTKKIGDKVKDGSK